MAKQKPEEKFEGSYSSARVDASKKERLKRRKQKLWGEGASLLLMLHYLSRNNLYYLNQM